MQTWLKDQIGLFSQNGELLTLSHEMTEKGHYRCFHFDAVLDLERWCSTHSCKLVVLVARKLAECDDSNLELLSRLLDERNIISLILTQTMEELHLWKRRQWPLAHFIHTPWSPTLVKNKVGSLLAERLLIGRPRIALIEDESWRAKHLQATLSSYGYLVSAIASEQNGCIQHLLAENPDVILLDMVAQKNDGFQTYKRIKDNPYLTDVPLFFVAYQRQQDEKSAKVCIPSVGSAQAVENLMALDVPRVVEKVRECIEKIKMERSIIFRERLTGLFNQEALGELIDRQMALSERRNEPFSMVMLSFAQAEKIAENYGRLFLDALMRSFGHFIQSRVRRSDIVAHNGQGKFYIMLEGIGRSKAALVCERLLHFFRLEMGHPGDPNHLPLPAIHHAIVEYPEDGSSGGHLFEKIELNLKNNMTNSLFVDGVA